MHQLLTTAPGYAVNVLHADQQDLAVRFARPGDDRFGGLNLHQGRHNIPLIGGAIAHIECDRHTVLDGGDHTIILGRIQGLAVHDGEPMLYVQGAFLDLPKPHWDRALANAPTSGYSPHPGSGHLTSSPPSRKGTRWLRQ